MKRLIPPDDCPEEIARRLDVIQQHRALNAILGVNPDAMSQAEQHQQQRRRGEPIGPLHGVPLIVKDNIACAPMPITLGCRALASLNATADARVVQRLRRAGAIILARANMSEFAFDVRSRSSLGVMWRIHFARHSPPEVPAEDAPRRWRLEWRMAHWVPIPAALSAFPVAIPGWWGYGLPFAVHSWTAWRRSRPAKIPLGQWYIALRMPPCCMR